MSLRPPRKPPADIWTRSPAAALDYEIARETASTLGRLGRALEAALKALADFDAAHPQAADRPAERRQRTALVAAAGQVLWEFVVQRECCGLRDGAAVMRMYKVPGEVQDRMGIVPRKPS
jgi:hypothetical protein